MVSPSRGRPHLRLISRSSHETYSQCPRKFYYQYLYKGTGFDDPRPAFPLLIGLGVHKGLEVILLTGDVEEAVEKSREEWLSRTAKWNASVDPATVYQIEEGEALVEGLVRGWYRARYADFIQEFEVVAVEQEVATLLAPNVTLQARADATIRRRTDGTLWVLNWKTTSSTIDWTAQWEDEVQAWTEALSMEHSLQEPIAGVIFEGLYKGVKREGMYASPLIYGWQCPSPSGIVYSATYERFSKEKPWRKFAIWRDFPGGLQAWINWMPSSVLEEQFIRSEPILKNDRVVEAWIRQVVRRETDIEHILEVGDTQDKEDFFWQNFKKFNCRFCPFRPVCKKQVDIEDAIEAGHFVPREDHHATSRT